MGCWDETCGLTNTVVHVYDPVVMVVIKPKDGPNSYSVFGNGSWDFKHVAEIHKGTYNDYGWIKEIDIDSRDPRLEYIICFFHKRVWDEVVDFEKNHTTGRKGGKIENVEDTWSPGSSAIKKMIKLASENEPENEQYIKKMKEEYKLPEFAEEFIYITRFAEKIRRDIVSVTRWRGYQDDWDQAPRQLIHRLSMEHLAQWKFDPSNTESLLLDQYGRYYLEDQNDPESKISPENPSLSERIADVLRTDDKWGWKEAINIHNYTPFDLLREAQEVLRAIEIAKDE